MCVTLPTTHRFRFPPKPFLIVKVGCVFVPSTSEICAVAEGLDELRTFLIVELSLQFLEAFVLTRSHIVRSYMTTLLLDFLDFSYSLDVS